MEIQKSYLTQNDCYKAGRKIVPKGIVVHDTACDQRKVSAYLTSWNKPGVEKCVHAFIGLRPDGSFGVVQTLPWEHRCWGCGSGKKGSYNASHIQFELCQDDRTDGAWFGQCYDKAVELCAWLCREYDIPVEQIVDHAEAHAAGWASNHGDTADWFPLYGKSMDTLRADVAKALEGAGFTPYLVRIETDSLNVRKGPGVKYGVATTVKRGEVFTIVEEAYNGPTLWGRLKSGAGWISLGYTSRR